MYPQSLSEAARAVLARTRAAWGMQVWKAPDPWRPSRRIDLRPRSIQSLSFGRATL